MSNGLLTGVSEGLKLGLQGFVGERDRRDKRALAEQELFAKQEERQETRKRIAEEALIKENERKIAHQKNRANLIGQDFIPYDGQGLLKPGQILQELDGEKFVYDPEVVQKRKVQVSGAQATEKARIDSEKDSKDYALGSKVPDFEMQQGFRPKLEDIGKFRTSKNATAKLKNLTGQIKNILETSGPQGLPGEQRGNLKRLTTQLMMVKKEADKLGVLTGPDLGLLIDQIGDSTSFFDQIARGGYDSAKKQYINNLIALDSAAEFDLNTEASNLGFKPASQKPTGLIAGANAQNATANNPIAQKPTSLAGVGSGSGVPSEVMVGNKKFVLNPKTGKYMESK
jgi:hypothetical protein